MTGPLLTTKLNIPTLRSALVPRPHLVKRLNDGLHARHRLILISAPAGFGKTTLLGEWVQGLPKTSSLDVKVAWLSLDDGDNDPARFSAYLAAVLQGIQEYDKQVEGESYEFTGALLQETNLVQVINQIAKLSQAFVLVLDDYHLITSQAVHDAVAFLVDHPSENLHLILATRADPPLPLPRLRARGHLTELRQSDLRFTAEEAAVFLNNVMGLGLSAQDVNALEARTEGWIAGLQMAALSLQGQPGGPSQQARSEFIRAFSGSHRFVLDYLVEEVLDQQPAIIQEFLLKTSILEQLSGQLCDAIAGEQAQQGQDISFKTSVSQFHDSQTILEHLETSNLFIVPLDHERRWYRYHRLFADLLQQRLQRSHPDLLPALHQHASIWYEEQGMISPAIDHALDSHNFDRAASLIEENVEAALMRSEIITFINWVGRLPDELVCRRPTLCFYHTWALVMSGSSLDVFEQRLQDLAHLQDTDEGNSIISGRLAALRAYFMLFQADMKRASELCKQALEQLPEDELFVRSIVEWISSLINLIGGDLQDSKQMLKEIARTNLETGNLLIAVVALCHRAKLQMRQGRLQRARETLEQALQIATDPLGRWLPVASEALLLLGELEREWNNLDGAVDYLNKSIQQAKKWSELASFDSYYPLARVRLAQGDVAGAREAIETARQIADESEGTQVDDLVADLQQAVFFATQGDFAGAMQWAERRGLVPFVPPDAVSDLDKRQDTLDARLLKYEQLVLGRLLILQGQSAEALDVLDGLLDLARQLKRTDMIIEIQILRALAFQIESDNTQAREALSEALSLAEPGGYIRIFIDEGEPMVRLLQMAAAENIYPAYTSKLLKACGISSPVEIRTEHTPPPTQSLIEPLSERELDVLRLLATGMSNPEIAEELVIAVSTVHSHCKSIYSKLGVHKRWDAVQRGKELALI